MKLNFYHFLKLNFVFLIILLAESLSDSTIYMAYYTVAHILQGENFRSNGSKNKYNIDPKDMTPEVWDHIFFKDCPAPKKSNIPKAAFDEVYIQFKICRGKNVSILKK